MDMYQVIRLVLDSLGFDLFQMPEVLIRDVRRPSLVRKIGTLLPLSPARRAKFQAGVLGNNNRTVASLSKDSDCMDCASFGDVGLLIEEVSFVNGIRMRAERRRSHIIMPTFSTPDSSAISRISELEDELAKLRQQIATIVLLQEQSLSIDGDCSTEGPQPTNSSQKLDQIGVMNQELPVTFRLPGGTVPPAPPLPCGVPQPPPSGAPPPPPPPPVQTPKRSAIDLIKEARANGKANVNKSDSRPDMAEILKGIGKVRLRAVERSPGGTPLRRMDPKPQSPIDPASLIAYALKKKFAHRDLFSPDSKNSSPDNKENRSPLNSPSIEGPPLLKPSMFRGHRTKRRSSPQPVQWQINQMV